MRRRRGGNKGPEATELTPADEVTLGFRAPEQQAVTHRISGVDTAAVRKLQPSRYEEAMPWVYQEVTKVVPVSQPPMAM